MTQAIAFRCVRCLAPLVAWLVAGAAWAQSPEFPKRRGLVNDFAAVLTPAQDAELESYLKTVQQQTSVELALVTVQTVKPSTIEAYATGLFNTWGLGQQGVNNGVMLLLAKGDRQVRIEVGIGLEAKLGDDEAGRIIDTAVLPFFRDGDLAGGLGAGLRAIAKKAADYDTPGTSASAPGASAPATSDASLEAAAPASPPRPWYDIDLEDVFMRNGPMPFVYLGGGGLVVLLVGYRLIRALVRRRQRYCPTCATPLERLSEADEDQFLSKIQQAEETVGSAAWDVWRCAQCGFSMALRWNLWLDFHGTCSKCKGETLKVTTEVLRSPTYTSTGQGRRTEKCAGCGHSASSTYTIPKRTRSTSSSSGSRSSSSFSSSRSSSGGGRSRGGGASRSW